MSEFYKAGFLPGSELVANVNVMQDLLQPIKDRANGKLIANSQASLVFVTSSILLVVINKDWSPLGVNCRRSVKNSSFLHSILCAQYFCP